MRKVFPSLSSSEEEEEEDSLQCFVIDSHRPIHLGNIYAQNVFVLDDMLQSIQSENLPEDNSDLSMNESSSDGSSSSSEESSLSERDFDSDDSFSRKRKRREKKYTSRKNRRKVLNQYYLSTSYGAASSMVAYEIAKETSKDTNELLWLAIVGLTTYYVHGDMNTDTYHRLFQGAQTEVASKNSDEAKTMLTGEAFDTVIPVSEDGRITANEDYRFFLYRHWNLYDAMLYSNYVSTNMALWTARGKKTLERLIAKIGIPLKSCRQKFGFMSDKLKTRLELRLEECSKEFDLEHVRFHTFNRRDGFSESISASDVVHSTTALLECDNSTSLDLNTSSSVTTNATSSSSSSSSSPSSSPDRNHSLSSTNDSGATYVQEDEIKWIERFNLAYDSLRRSSKVTYRHGIARAKQLQQVVFQMATSVIERKQIKCAGPFRYTVLQNLTTAESSFFVQPRILTRLAKFVVSAYRDQGKWTNRRALPYVVCVPNEKRNTHLVVGVMCPGRFEVQGNYLGRAFRVTADELEAQYKHDRFDAAAIELGMKTTPTQFFSVLMEKLEG